MTHNAPIRSLMEKDTAPPPPGRQPARGRFPSFIAPARTTIAAGSLILILSTVCSIFPFLERFPNALNVMAGWKLFSALFAAAPLLSRVEGLKILDLSASKWTVGNAEFGIQVPAKVPSVVWLPHRFEC
jgi:hypothetical protein